MQLTTGIFFWGQKKMSSGIPNRDIERAPPHARNKVQKFSFLH